METIQIIDGPTSGEIFTAQSFVEYLRKSSPIWWKDEDDDCSWVFRGQRDSSWKLLPAAGREESALDKKFLSLIAALDKLGHKEIENWHKFMPINKQQILRVWAYALCLERFMKLAGDLRFRIEDAPNTDQILNIIKSCKPEQSATCASSIHDFLAQDRAGDFPSKITESVALAQHHGVPTFLLDWTRDPLVSCHFAAETTDSDIAVWALNARAIEKIKGSLLSSYVRNFSSCSIRIYRPRRSENQYLASQAGVFSVLLYPEKYWHDNERYPAFEDIIAKCNADKMREALDYNNWGIGNKRSQIEQAIHDFESHTPVLLKKIILPSSQTEELQRVLYREGFSKAHMMPSLDNVAETAMSYMATKNW